MKYKKMNYLTKLKQNREVAFSMLMIIVPVMVLIVAAILARPSLNQDGIKVAAGPAPIHKNAFDDIVLEARSAIVKNINSGEVLYEKNSHLPLPLASITKVLTAIVAAANENGSSLSNAVASVSAADLAVEGNSLLLLGERFSKKDLINFTLITSSNDGAAALASNTFRRNPFFQPVSGDGIPDNKFVAQMNSTARKIGMSSSYFYNETGLDNNETTAGSHGSAADVATLFEYALTNYPEVMDATKESVLYIRSLTGIIHEAKNTNEVVGELPNVIASKTGYTDIAGGNLAVVIDPALNTPIIIVVLGSSEDGRFDDVKKLSDAVIKSFADSNLEHFTN